MSESLFFWSLLYSFSPILFIFFFFTPLRKRGLSQPRLKVFLSGVVSTYGVDHHTSTTVEGGTRYHCCKVSS